MLLGKVNGQEVYSSALEPSLKMGDIFIPGVTCTDKYDSFDASAVRVYKVGGTEITKPTSGDNKVSDYTHTEASDEIITLLYNNKIQESHKFYNVQEATVPYEIGLANFDIAVGKATGDANLRGLACLIQESTEYSDTTAITETNLKSIVLDMRKELSNNNAKPNTVVCTYDTYMKVVSVAGKEFNSDVANQIAYTGEIGKWLGLFWVPTSAFTRDSWAYVDNTGAFKDVSFDGVDFIMYDFDTYSHMAKGTDAGIYDGHPHFNGKAAQVEMWLSTHVTNKKRALVKKHV